MAFRKSVMDRACALKSGQLMTENQKRLVSEGFAQLFQEVSWFVRATRDQSVSRFLNCGLVVVDDIAVHLPVVLADFMGTSKNKICKYMKEWNWKFTALKVDEISTFPDIFK
jgi:hypothetical protein